MAFSGGLGAELVLDGAGREKGLGLVELLFGESPSRLVLEVAREKEREFRQLLKGLPAGRIGYAAAPPLLCVSAEGRTLFREDISGLKTRWKRELI
jgi:phosphoribosylformylglycinamidine (FGAM) synthase-like enzyme